ncbi:MAG: RlmE family RNA methyltransferase [Candidatus Brockarchaeota archaeon]|nr:RlmE family RNA methyltransferase [Candidatus Brockarchaeota archaeon]
MLKSKRRWLQERKRDPYFILSKKEGYRSRASYKLKQILDKYRVIRTGDIVLDIGCAPGGWLQVASEAVGETGLVIGVDVKEVENLGSENIKTIVLDVFDEDFVGKVLKESKSRFDVILSDLSPNMSGIYELDHARQIEMVERVLQLSRDLLKTGGSMVIKVFEGEGSDRVYRRVMRLFRFVKRFKPKASRKGSSEFYLVARFFKGF